MAQSVPHFPDDEAAASFLFKSIQRAMASGDLNKPDQVIRDLRPTQVLLERLGSPTVAGGMMLVTGSKGKGSTSIIAAAVLKTLGYRVGLMTSPSLVNFRERIRVDGRAIPADDFIRLVERIVPHVEEIDAGLPPDGYFSPTGMILALALMHFAASDVQVAVIEAGRGGRFDDTRLVDNAVSVLTPIMYEHTHELGPTLTDIAWHKAGIIKPGNGVVSAAQEQEALAVVEREVAEQHAHLRLLKRDFEASLVAPGTLDRPGLTLTLRTATHDYGEVWLSLLGDYQVENTAVAVSGVEALLEKMDALPGPATLDHAVREALARVTWPGRCQVLLESPLTFLDGAINDESAGLFRESVADLVRPPVSALMSVPDTKDYRGVFRQMGRIASSAVITRFDSPYLTFPNDDVALAAAREHFRTAEVRPDFAAAYQEARRLAGDGGTVLIVGTQSLSKAALRHWNFNLEVI